MNKFILLHSVDESKPILLSIDKIILARKSNIFTGATDVIIDISDEEDEAYIYAVVESPEKILELINENN